MATEGQSALIPNNDSQQETGHCPNRRTLRKCSSCYSRARLTSASRRFCKRGMSSSVRGGGLTTQLSTCLVVVCLYKSFYFDLTNYALVTYYGDYSQLRTLSSIHQDATPGVQLCATDSLTDDYLPHVQEDPLPSHLKRIYSGAYGKCRSPSSTPRCKRIVQHNVR
ncbi:hypothetical protein J6590_055199 [Homalodisca vitripennis]|nr:hypothetical protein J6590_055199 [Homalodisca vitripennis]